MHVCWIGGFAHVRTHHERFEFPSRYTPPCMMMRMSAGSRVGTSASYADPRYRRNCLYAWYAASCADPRYRRSCRYTPMYDDACMSPGSVASLTSEGIMSARNSHLGTPPMYDDAHVCWIACRYVCVLCRPAVQAQLSVRLVRCVLCRPTVQAQLSVHPHVCFLFPQTVFCFFGCAQDVLRISDGG